MKTVPFTRSEYGVLLELVYLGMWVLIATDRENDPTKDKHRALAEKLYSRAKEMGCSSLIEEPWGNLGALPTPKFEDRVMALIDEYDLRAFWEDLAYRLAERDAALQIPDLAGQVPRSREHSALPHDLEKKYAEEFATHGLSRVTVSGM